MDKKNYSALMQKIELLIFGKITNAEEIFTIVRSISCSRHQVISNALGVMGLANALEFPLSGFQRENLFL